MKVKGTTLLLFRAPPIARDSRSALASCREKTRVYDISTGQYESSSGLLGQLTNSQNIYVVRKKVEVYVI